MKYFIDTEFIEGFHKPLFGKRRHFIDLISIGIVCEDGRKYYAISSEFNAKDADEWVKENVINKLPSNNEKPYKSNKQIAIEIVEFCSPSTIKNNGNSATYNFHHFGEIDFYGYYADYDWVLFCSLFGRMIDLPKGFPMYCKDLKQMLDEAYIHQEQKYINETRLESWLKTVKNNSNYPKQENEHNALDDAQWNYKLYKFLNGLPGNLISENEHQSIGAAR